MHRKTAFIGHRSFLPRHIEERLREAIQIEIDLGCRYFTMGTHGDFDKRTLSICKEFKRKYSSLEIEVVLTSLNQLKTHVEGDIYGKTIYKPYENVKTIMYDVEEEHFKRKITVSNQQMIEGCDTLICYVRPNEIRSGAKTAMNYAKKLGLKIVNLYKEEDHPLYHEQPMK